MFKSDNFSGWFRACLFGVLSFLAAEGAVGEDIGWVEDFVDDPVVAGRFIIPNGHDQGMFTYNGTNQLLTVHYDTFLPTAWYVRPLDPVHGQSLGRCDDFEFSVTFRMDSLTFDPFNFGQIGWGLLNLQSTGVDRAGGTAGPYAFDVFGFDYFPNDSFGTTTISPTVIHSDEGQDFFSAFSFPAGDESLIDPMAGDEGLSLSVVYTARIEYDSADQAAVLTIRDSSGALAIGADGAGGPGGPDADPSTIQVMLTHPEPFSVDSFALTAWKDTFNIDGTSSVLADVDVMEITFFARTLVKGDMNRDGRVDGLDIGPFVDTLLATEPAPCAVQRADFTNDAAATTDDIADFEAALLAP